MNIETTERPSRWPAPEDLEIATVGEPRHDSPLATRRLLVDETDRVILPSSARDLQAFLDAGEPVPAFEPAGPRPRLYYDPARLTCAIVTCGGLCPGLNNVIRAIVLQLTHAYGVQHILGFRYGFAGLAKDGPEPLDLTPEAVESLHETGGTLLGSSRGPQDLGEMVDTLERLGVAALFVIGGDGGLSGASALHQEIRTRGRDIAVVGVPKTIDNDLHWTWRSFGFDTAVSAASDVILSAHAEAIGAWNGVSVVKLMGRHSGFIAAHATLACSDVNFCLVPEVPFALEGGGGFFEALEKRLEARRHAVVVIAEGAGQDLMRDGSEPEYDASGNIKLKDVGTFLRDRIKAHFDGRGLDVVVRYIDPSYTIRSLPANSFDAQYCLALGQHAVHAVLAGRTDLCVGFWNQRMIHLPLRLATEGRKTLDPRGETWQRVLEATGQPARMSGEG